MNTQEKSKRRIRFESIAVRRVQTILDNLDRLENCSNRNNYEYFDADFKKIFRTIREKTEAVTKEFEKQLNKGKKNRFSL